MYGIEVFCWQHPPAGNQTGRELLSQTKVALPLLNLTDMAVQTQAARWERFLEGSFSASRYVDGSATKEDELSVSRGNASKTPLILPGATWPIGGASGDEHIVSRANDSYKVHLYVLCLSSSLHL